MKSNIFLRVITGCVVLLWANYCSANNLTPEKAKIFADTKGKEILMIFQEEDLVKRYAALDEMIKNYIDIDYISKFVIGKYRQMMSQEQKQKYRNIFERYGLALYKTLPLHYAKDLTFEIKGAEVDKNFVNVAANVTVRLGKEKQEISLFFRMHETSEGIKLVDVKIAESSLLLSYRSKFYQMIAQSDNEIEWFLEDLETMAVSYEYNLRQNILKQQKLLEIETKNK